MDITGAVAGIRGVILGVLGFTPSARLRSDIDRDVKLAGMLREAQLGPAAELVEGLVHQQTEELVRRRKGALTRQRPWTTPVVASAFAMPLAICGWLLLPPGGWLSWAGIVAVGVGLFFFVVGGVGAFFTTPPEKNDQQEQSQI